MGLKEESNRGKVQILGLLNTFSLIQNQVKQKKINYFYFNLFLLTMLKKEHKCI